MCLYLLDTNMISSIIKGRSAAARTRLAGLGSDEVACISTITEGELLYGMARSGFGEARRRSVDLLLGRLRIEPWGREEAKAYGALRPRQDSLSRPLGPLDTQIAAHAIAIGAVLVSSDLAFKHATDLPGFENWASDLHPDGP